MDRRRTSPLFPPLAAALALSACFTDPVIESPGGSSSGSLSVDALTLSWKPGSSWPQGQCTDFTLTNGGQPLEDWSLVVRLNQPLTSLLSSYGATFTPSGDLLTIVPIQHSLAYGASVQFQFCGEPASWPVEILEAELEPAGPDPTPTPTEPVNGSLQDERLALVYRTKGSSNGGTCLEMTVTNVTSAHITGWSLQLTMSDEVDWTDAWNCTPIASGRSLKLYPLAGLETLSAYQGKAVTVCFDPLVYPVTMEETVQVKP